MRMPKTTAGLMLIAMLLALAGCDAPPGPGGEPGSLSVHMDGRAGSFVGVR